MKHFLVLGAAVLLGALGTVYHPFWGVLLYYTFSVLRPQYLWDWSLPARWRWSLIAAAIAAIGAFAHLPKLLAKNRVNLIVVLILALSVLLFLSTLTAHNPSLAQHYGIEYAKIIAIALLACLVIDQLWQIRILAGMILLMLGYVAYEVNYLYFIDHRLDIFHQGYGGLDNNGAGLMLVMGLPFAYAFAHCVRVHWQRVACAVLGVLIIHAVMMSYSRGAMLAAMVGVGWLLWHHRSKLQAAGMMVMLVAVVLALAGPEIRHRFMSTLDYQDDHSAQSRLDSWSAGWQMAWERPLLGHGIRNANLYSANFGADVVGRTIHSQYLQMAADCGLPAVAVYVCLVGSALMSLRRARVACRAYLQRSDADYWWGPIEDPEADEVRQVYHIALACSASLLMFVTGGLFLSLELFELPWLLIVTAAVLPLLVEKRIGLLAARATQSATTSPEKASRGSHRRRASRGRRASPRPRPGRALREGTVRP